jgi:hypothetical protein
MDVEQSWKNEEALSIEDRRARYSAPKYFTKDNLRSWDIAGFEKYSQSSTLGKG